MTINLNGDFNIDEVIFKDLEGFKEILKEVGESMYVVRTGQKWITSKPLGASFSSDYRALGLTMRKSDARIYNNYQKAKSVAEECGGDVYEVSYRKIEEDCSDE